MKVMEFDSLEVYCNPYCNVKPRSSLDYKQIPQDIIDGEVSEDKAGKRPVRRSHPLWTPPFGLDQKHRWGI